MYFEASLKERVLKFLRLVSRRYASLPRDITIEVSTRCPQQCAMCFRSPLALAGKTMDFGLFTRIVERIGSGFAGKPPGYLNFVGLGEPFCNEALAEMLGFAKKTLPETGMNVSTSLAAFDRAAFAGWAEGGIINRLSISIDGVDETGPFHPFTPEIADNFRFIQELRTRRSDFRIRVQTLMISQKQVREVVELARSMGADELQLMRIDLHAFSGKPPVTRPPLEEERAIVRLASRLAADCGIRCLNNNSHDLFMDIASRYGRTCLITDDHIFIDVDGEVRPCFCLRATSFGNLGRKSLAEVVRNKRASGFYRTQRSLCSGCDIYRKDQRPRP